MSEWLLEKYLSKDPLVNLNELTIWVLHADKTPPHIGLSIENAFFSLKINGKDEALELNSLLSLINKKKLPTLAIVLQSPLDKAQVKNVFASYGPRIQYPETCLSPIVRLLSPTQSELILIELLQELDKNQQIKKVYGFHLPIAYQGIPSYTKEIIQQRINAVQPSER
jgi:hypothetical protein